jgi:hypothetical protein
MQNGYLTQNIIETSMTVPFEQRVFPAMQASLPRMAQLIGYCPSSTMTSALVERLVLETEEAIGEPIRHTIRKAFPQPLDRSIADEVELGWKAPKRTLMLCNQLSRPNHVLVTANRFPRPKGGAYPADFGVFSIGISSVAPRALDVLTRLQTYATSSGAFMARADSPEWLESTETVLKVRGFARETFFPRIRFISENGWGISERFGWGTYIGPRCALAFGSLATPELIEPCKDGGAVVWLTKAPFDFRDETHFSRHQALKKELEGHLHPGTQIGEL